MLDQNARISLLDNRLANQIAAGEVVERPASVVKELIENCIDAGATRVEVDIERGGARLIRITDNGRGIHKDDLPLALTRHATSKIKTNDDLANIQSLGFRGEALASISSVSRLTLTSRTHESDLAWQAIAQGRDMAVEVLPAAASPGTRIEIADLFFNTPARQKFLRTEKTEFNHIEEVFKRHALANFEIAFVLKHNHKIVKRVPACGEVEQRLKRIATICGRPFSENVIPFECQHEVVRLWGWLGKPNFHRSESDIQYVFINGRPVKDKTLNHAIRQAYEGLLPPGRMATYVIFLEVDPRQVDVNVHPTKHEVRFSEQRLVHDLLAKSLADALQEQLVSLPLVESQPYAVESRSDVADDSETFTSEIYTSGISQGLVAESTDLNQEFKQPVVAHKQRSGSISRYQPSDNKAKYNTQGPHSQHSSNDVSESESKRLRVEESNYRAFNETRNEALNERINPSNLWLHRVENNIWLTFVENDLVCFKADLLLKEYVQSLIKEKRVARQKSLLFPSQLELPVALLEDFACHQVLAKLGFETSPSDGSYLLIKRVPEWLDSLESSTIFDQLPLWLELLMNNNSEDEFFSKLFDVMPIVSDDQVRLLLTEMSNDLKKSGSIRKINGEVFAGLYL